MQSLMLDRKLLEHGSESAAHEPFITLDDCIESAEELLERLSRLGMQKHPLDVRKGVRSPVTDNEPSRTVKASSRTYFFDVKTAKDGSKYLIITESRIKEKQRSQITVFPEEAQAFVLALREMSDLLR